MLPMSMTRPRIPKSSPSDMPKMTSTWPAAPWRRVAANAGHGVGSSFMTSASVIRMTSYGGTGSTSNASIAASGVRRPELVDDAHSEHVAVDPGDAAGRRPAGRSDGGARVVESVDLAGDRRAVRVGLVDLDRCDVLDEDRIGQPTTNRGHDRRVDGRRRRPTAAEAGADARSLADRVGHRVAVVVRGAELEQAQQDDDEQRQDQGELDHRLATLAVALRCGPSPPGTSDRHCLGSMRNVAASFRSQVDPAPTGVMAW